MMVKTKQLYIELIQKPSKKQNTDKNHPKNKNVNVLWVFFLKRRDIDSLLHINGFIAEH